MKKVSVMKYDYGTSSTLTRGTIDIWITIRRKKMPMKRYAVYSHMKKDNKLCRKGQGVTRAPLGHYKTW